VRELQFTQSIYVSIDIVTYLYYVYMSICICINMGAPPENEERLDRLWTKQIMLRVWVSLHLGTLSYLKNTGGGGGGGRGFGIFLLFFFFFKINI